MHRCRLVAALVLLGCLLAAPAAAEDAWVDASGESPYRVSVDLAADGAPPARIEGEFGRHEMTIMAPVDDALERVALKLPIRTAGTLHPDSRLLVELNGEPLGEVSLDGFERERRVHLELDASGFEPGANTLSFTVQAHHAESCQAEATHSLWTELMLSDAELAFDFARPPRRPSEALAEALLAASPGSMPMAIVRPDEARTSQFLDRAGMVAQGYGLRVGDQPPSVRVVSPEAADTVSAHRVFVGTDEALADTVDSSLLRGVSGPSREAVFDAETGRLTMVFTGETDEDVQAAVEAFTEVDADPEIPLIERPRTVRFDALGHDMNPGYAQVKETTLRFRLPAGYHQSSRRTGGPVLNLSMGLAAHTPVRAEVLVNGRWRAGKPVELPEGGVVDNFQIALPWDALAPGVNVITVRFVMPPEPSGHCPEDMFERDTRLMVFGDSTIRFTPFQDLSISPEISQAILGYPGTEVGAIDLVALGGSASAEGGVLTLAADLAQARGQALRVRGHTRIPGNRSGAIIAAGALHEIPAHVFEQTRLSRTYLREAFRTDDGEPGRGAEEEELPEALLNASSAEREAWIARYGRAENRREEVRETVFERLIGFAEDFRDTPGAFGEALPWGLDRIWNALPEPEGLDSALFETPGPQANPVSTLVLTTGAEEDLQRRAHRMIHLDRSVFRGGGVLHYADGAARTFRPSVVRYDFSHGLSLHNLRMIAVWAEQNILAFVALLILGMFLLSAGFYVLLRLGRRHVA